MKKTIALCLLSACAPDYEVEATLGVKEYVSGEIDVLHGASIALRASAPAPDANGWNLEEDAAAIETMRAEWVSTRITYERIEGAIAVLFPQIDETIDQRYDFFIALEPDPDPFDGEIATGMHSIERILWAGEHPPEVTAFESSLANYSPARMPETESEARTFESGISARLVDDVVTMRDQFEPVALDPAAAYRGVVGSMGEQLEKVTLAATGEDESRYSQATLADMRANLEGGRAIYSEFSAWIRSRDGGAAIDDRILAGFDRIAARYAAIDGDSLPEVPAGWNPDDPDPAHLDTEYGQLWSFLSHESDPDAAGSLVSDMIAGANSIGILVLP
jgi:iron uptake system component EfeO